MEQREPFYIAGAATMKNYMGRSVVGLHLLVREW